MRIAWLGTGLMGRPMAARLLEAGQSVAVWNRTGSRTAPLLEHGAHFAATPAAAIRDAEVVFTMLRDGPTTREVLRRDDPPMAGKAVIQMGTIGSAESRELAATIEAAGGEYLEAPVLGSIPHARDGRLSVFAGGAESLFARLLPFLEILGHEPRLVGPVGAAATLKLAYNQLVAAEAAAFCLSLGLVRRAGVDVELFMSILRESNVYAASFDRRLARYLGRDYANPTFSLELLLKDTALARAEAAAFGLATKGIEGVRAVVEAAVDRGLGALDYAALYEAIDPPGAAPASGTS